MSRAILFATIHLTGVLFLAGATPAGAADGRTTAGGPISAGPGTAYHAIERLGPRLNVAIYGCLAAWDWCDVSWRGRRGWIAASSLSFADAGELTAMDAPGARAGVPVVAFEAGAYWDQNYSKQAWYSERALDQ